MATETQREFLPFGEFLPDHKLFGNQGLVRAFGVSPVADNYIQAPDINLPGGDGNELTLLGTDVGGRTDDAFGFHVHQVFASGLRQVYCYYGAKDALAEIDLTAGSPLAETDRSRATGYAFATSPPTIHDMWWFTSFGENVVATNLEDEVQFLATPGSGLFANMITSTFKPQFRFCVPIRQNLFGFYCSLPADYDGILAGTHPQLGVWSQNDNIQAFGSENVDPSLVGAGYQQFIGGDAGPITAAIGGSFGIVFLAGGIVRIDGPPYEFRTIVTGDTTLHPYSVFKLGQDVYFWGSGGPSVLRDGNPPVERLGVAKLQRSLLDNTTGFGSDFAVSAAANPRHISGGADPINDLVRWAYIPTAGSYVSSDIETSGGTPPTILIDYSLRTERFTVSRSTGIIITEPNPPGAGRDFFLRSEPLTEGAAWGPFGRILGLKENFEDTGENWYVFRYALKGGFGEVPAMEFRTGFGRLSETKTSRITAVRPIWSNTEGQAASVEGTVEVQVHTKNKPWEDETNSNLHSTFNDDGWIGVDSTVAGTYHSLTLRFKNTSTAINEIHEIEGLEVQFVAGGEYGV